MKQDPLKKARQLLEEHRPELERLAAYDRGELEISTARVEKAITIARQRLASAGGIARAKKLPKKRRQEIARLAGLARQQKARLARQSAHPKEPPDYMEQ
jgi:hypothetical protein